MALLRWLLINHAYSHDEFILLLPVSLSDNKPGFTGYRHYSFLDFFICYLRCFSNMLPFPKPHISHMKLFQNYWLLTVHGFLPSFENTERHWPFKLTINALLYSNISYHPFYSIPSQLNRDHSFHALPLFFILLLSNFEYLFSLFHKISAKRTKRHRLFLKIINAFLNIHHAILQNLTSNHSIRTKFQ